MQIDLSEEERQLLLQTVETSTYAGRLAELVVSVLKKLKQQEKAGSKKK